MRSAMTRSWCSSADLSTRGGGAAPPSRARLRHIGVGGSLDDSGTGFSSLQHLRQLPPTEVKIDQSFVKSMQGSPRDEAIVRAVIDLGRELGLRVVAEGVEDEETGMRLLLDGCRVAQGWYYAAPMPAYEFSRWRTRSRGPVRVVEAAY